MGKPAKPIRRISQQCFYGEESFVIQQPDGTSKLAHYRNKKGKAVKNLWKGALSIEKNEHDGHTLEEALNQFKEF